MISLLAALLCAVAIARPAAADDTFDTTGWTLLGEQTVNGKHDTDTIVVGRKEGRFTKLALLVSGGDLELDSMLVTFGNGATQAPEMRHSFKAGSLSRMIDLIGDDRGIETIELVYGNADRGKGKNQRRGSDTAKVSVWGLEAAVSPVAAWDPTGWDLIAKKKITRKKGSITVKVSKRGATYNRLNFVIGDSDLKITDVAITYARGRQGRHKYGRDFRGESRWGELDLVADGAGRAIKSVKISYSNRTGGKFANISVYGREIQTAAPVAWTFDSKGWELLGEQTVDSKRDRDTIKVGRDDGKFSKLAVVVLDDDVEMTGMTVHLGGKRRKGDEDLFPELRHTFQNGSRSREIDLPGGAAVVIKDIELIYGTTRGGGKARVQIWGK